MEIGDDLTTIIIAAGGLLCLILLIISFISVKNRGVE